MTAARGRILILAGAAGVLLAVVAADRGGLIPGRAADGDGPIRSGPRARYLERLAEDRAERALLAREAAWSSARREAEERWRQVQGMLVTGATPELAEARFREMVLAAFEGIRVVSPARITYVRDGVPATGAIRPIRLRIDFDAPSAREAYTLIDRLEHLADARSAIVAMRIDGPGRIQLPEQVTVSLTLAAVAYIGGRP